MWFENFFIPSFQITNTVVVYSLMYSKTTSYFRCFIVLFLFLHHFSLVWINSSTLYIFVEGTTYWPKLSCVLAL